MKANKFKYLFLIAAVSLSFALSACSNLFVSNERKITIAGSTTILPISERIASAFQKSKGVIVNVQGGGSSTGINSLREDKVDIAASSREPSAEESEGMKTITIGKDALVIIVHPTNMTKGLTAEQLKLIFSGQIKNWKAFGGPDRDIQIINRESGSGTRTTFEELVICPCPGKDCAVNSLASVVLNSNSEVKRSVQLIHDSIGYISFGLVDDSVKPLAIDEIVPTEENIINHKYPLTRSLYYMVKETKLTSSPDLNDFLAFIKTPEAMEIMRQEGFIPVE